MLLTITTTYRPATDLGFLLHKNPARCQEFEQSFGKVYVFFPEASDERCTVAVMLGVDPVGMVRGRIGSTGGGPLDQYVNDRPYTTTSFLSVAIAQVLGSALRGECKTKPELAATRLPLRATIPVLPCRRGGDAFLRRLFEPLGYAVEATRLPLDEKFPEWGDCLNDAVSRMVTGDESALEDIEYRPVGIKGEDVIVEVTASVESWRADHEEMVGLLGCAKTPPKVSAGQGARMTQPLTVLDAGATRLVTVDGGIQQVTGK
jgi:hypothetical protein